MNLFCSNGDGIQVSILLTLKIFSGSFKFSITLDTADFYKFKVQNALMLNIFC